MTQSDSDTFNAAARHAAVSEPYPPPLPDGSHVVKSKEPSEKLLLGCIGLLAISTAIQLANCIALMRLRPTADASWASKYPLVVHVDNERLEVTVANVDEIPVSVKNRSFEAIPVAVDNEPTVRIDDRFSVDVKVTNEPEVTIGNTLPIDVKVDDRLPVDVRPVR